MTIYKRIIKEITKKKIDFITIDGITCSGKTTFANILKKKIIKSFPSTLVISKDLFLYPRNRRIVVTKKYNKIKSINQNSLHYDNKKIKKLLNFLISKSGKKKILLKNLYNRKSGKNDFKFIIERLNDRLIIFEGIYINKEVKIKSKSILRILIIKDVYNSLFNKIKRIRDKKISIQLLISEFINIHLNSYRRYISKEYFDLYFESKNSKFYKIKNGKNIQLKNISNFSKKHIVN